MSLFVAIPSRLDIKKGFTRLRFWDQMAEWIHVAVGGSARKIVPDSSVESGLVLVSLAYFEQRPPASVAADLIKKSTGIFIHPGGTDTPNIAHAARAMQEILPEFRYKMLAKTVAFTRSGADDYQVVQLGRIWKWMADERLDGDSDIITNFDLPDIGREFGKLRAKQGRDAIARLCLLAQGSLDSEVVSSIRSKFAEELTLFLKGEGAWLGQDDKLGMSVTHLLEAGVTSETVANLMKAVRSCFD